MEGRLFERFHLIEDVEWNLLSSLWVCPLGVGPEPGNGTESNHLAFSDIEHREDLCTWICVEICQVPRSSVPKTLVRRTKPRENILHEKTLILALKTDSKNHVIMREARRTGNPLHQSLFLI